MLVPDPNKIVPDSLAIVTPPPLPAMLFVAPLKLYVPELPLMLMPVLVPLVCTLPLKVMVFVLLEAIVTTFAALACVIAPPQVTVPLVPVALNVEPAEPVNVTPEPPMVMPLRLRPFVAAPVVIFAVPETPTVPPPVAEKPVPVVAVMASVPLKVMTEVAPFVLRVTAAFVVVPNVCVPLK